MNVLALASPLVARGEPAGGAALDQIIIANAVAIVASGLLGWLVLGHRSGRVPYLGRAGAATERLMGLPSWAALPNIVSGISLIVALTGMYWDIALHIGVGRDAGPLANPAHYLILAGLFGIFAAGWLAIGLPKEKPGPTAVKIAPGWYAPVGGVMITACAFFALLGFPLDDLWHRLFGQDVTLWGPTHLMLIGGASLTLVGQAVLLVEGMRAKPRAEREGSQRFLVSLRRVGIMGAFLIGLSTFQAEFDFGVPQFQMVFQPMLIALAAAMALVCARLWIGPGGAFAAVGFFLAMRWAIALLIYLGFGESLPVTPLYLPEAALVELTALLLVRRPFAFAAVSGVLVGTVGFAAEYVWTHVVMPLPWNESLLPEGPILATVTGLAGAICGAMIALSLQSRLPGRAMVRPLGAVALLVVAIGVGYGLSTSEPDEISASVKLTEATPPPDREVQAQVRLDPPDTADDARWLQVTAWQGGGLVVNRLEEASGGTWRTTEPIPVHGEWKSILRLHKGDTIAGVPIYLPEDPVIPAPAVPARPSFTREFTTDKEILQRESEQDVAGWLTTAAPLVVLAIALSLLALLTWGLARLSRSGSQPEGGSERRGAGAIGPQPAAGAR
ncbi:MAG TPA: hypothetical protein VKA89_06700 [Solirubrobacterales bacterium]|nr:hypothetical protein [Solirubrobacterales bacterium]